MLQLVGESGTCGTCRDLYMIVLPSSHSDKMLYFGLERFHYNIILKLVTVECQSSTALANQFMDNGLVDNVGSDLKQGRSKYIQNTLSSTLTVHAVVFNRFKTCLW
jgi:hypothetical protein